MEESWQPQMITVTTVPLRFSNIQLAISLSTQSLAWPWSLPEEPGITLMKLEEKRRLLEKFNYYRNKHHLETSCVDEETDSQMIECFKDTRTRYMWTPIQSGPEVFVCPGLPHLVRVIDIWPLVTDLTTGLVLVGQGQNPRHRPTEGKPSMCLRRIPG